MCEEVSNSTKHSRSLSNDAYQVAILEPRQAFGLVDKWVSALSPLQAWIFSASAHRQFFENLWWLSIISTHFMKVLIGERQFGPVISLQTPHIRTGSLPDHIDKLAACQGRKAILNLRSCEMMRHLRSSADNLSNHEHLTASLVLDRQC